MKISVKEFTKVVVELEDTKKKLKASQSWADHWQRKLNTVERESRETIDQFEKERQELERGLIELKTELRKLQDALHRQGLPDWEKELLGEVDK